MDLEAFWRQTRVLLVVGKGGVGKTTTAAAVGLAAARSGRRALIVGLDDASTIPALFDESVPLTYAEQCLATTPAGGSLWARVLTPDEALLEYLESHGLGRVARRLVSSGVLDVVATAIPGIREVLVLGKVRQVADGDDADLIVVDAPASGHAMAFLTSAAGFLEVARSGPLRDQAALVDALLREPDRSQVLLVTLAEETPVNETIETAFRLEDEVGVALSAVVVNAVLPRRDHLETDPRTAADEAGVDLGVDLADALRRAARLREGRQQVQAHEMNRLAVELPLPRLELSFRFNAALGRKDLEFLADELDAAIGAL